MGFVEAFVSAITPVVKLSDQINAIAINRGPSVARAVAPHALDVFHVRVLGGQHQRLGDTVTVATFYTDALGVAAHVGQFCQPRFKSFAKLGTNIFWDVAAWQVRCSWI